MDLGEALERIGGGTAIVILGFVTGSVLEYGIKAVMARALHPEGYGAFIQSFAVIHVLVVVAVLGLHQSLPRFIGYYRGREDPGTVKSAAYTTGVLAIPVTVVAAVSVYLSADWLATTVFRDPLMVAPLQIMAVGLVPAALLYLAIAALRGFQDAVQKVVISDVVHPVIQLGLLIGLLSIGLGVTGAAYAYLIAVIIAALLALHRAAQYVRQVDTRPQFIPRQVLLFSWPLLIVAVIVTVNKWADVLMLGWLTSSTQAGVYEVAFAVAGFLLVFLSSLNYMFLPVVSELLGAGKRQTAADTYRAVTHWLLVFALPLYVGMLVFPSEILSLLFGVSYIAGSAVLQLLATGYFYATLTGPTGMLLLAAGRTKQFMAGLLVLGIVDVVLNLLLIPQYGMVGAAIGLGIAVILSNTVLLAFVYRGLGMHPFSPRFPRLFLAAAVAAVPLLAIKHVVQPSVIESVLLGGGYVIVYGVLVLVFRGVTMTDHSVAMDLLHRVTART